MPLDEILRQVVRDELRAILREEMPGLLRDHLTARGAGAQSPSVYLSTKDAASMAGVRQETIRLWVNSRKLPGHWAGSRLRVRRDELESFMAHGIRGPEEVDLDARARDILESRFKRKRTSR